MVRSFVLAGIVLAALGESASAAPCSFTGTAPNRDLILSNITCELSGVENVRTVSLTNNARINVNAYNGVNKVTTGNLELRATGTITIDSTSRIVARGSGYQTRICGNGQGPNATAGGRGGCSVMDSGGGGAHFGIGGRGTRDNPSGTSYFENDCSAPVASGGAGVTVTYNSSGVASCPASPDFPNPNGQCRNADDVPTVAGLPYFHSIYTPEFGASGGDKGCLDNDGRNPAADPTVGGAGGGRIVLSAVNAGKTGQITINGTLDANGKRGCGNGNDSGGGGAGGTIFVAGDRVTIGATAVITSSGGLGGDTQGLSTDPTGECVAPAQQGTTADDCGGGGGGGIVSVLSGTSANINDLATFNVNGAAGGVSTICRGEAGGGVGELQISGGYVGEFCDGFDNDFNGVVDDGLPTLDCGMSTIPSCVGGIPQTCPTTPVCNAPVTETRPRFAVIVDTSGSMLSDQAGVPTFGDGSTDNPGLRGNQSRLFLAKRALVNVISAYPSIDFALARYHQDQSEDRSCQMAHNFECNDLCCSYDNPTGNTGAAGCTKPLGVGGANITINKQSPTNEECINYAGNCGPPRRGADVLVGFGRDINNHLRWLDGSETAFDNSTTQGAYCNFPTGDCELRGTGPTPLANSLQAIEDYLSPIKNCDLAAAGSCRKYNVILLTDGAESCQGTPVAAAAALRAKGINTFVVGFSTLPSETAQLQAIATAGGTTALFANNESQLADRLAEIVSGSIVFETCNNADDDCDTRIDEDFPLKGQACDNGAVGACRGTGVYACNGMGNGVSCNITMPGPGSSAETCNGVDDDCDAKVDENLDCTTPCMIRNGGVDICNGFDDDCDGRFEEADTNVGMQCGSNGMAPCSFGTNQCIGGMIQCVGARDPMNEICNGLDDNCDGIGDNMATCPGTTSCVEGGCRVACAAGEFACAAGFRCESTPGGDFCVPSACANCAPNEVCQNDTCIDPCAGVQCGALEECRFGTCIDCNVFGCPVGNVCVSSACVADPCLGVDCTSGCNSERGCSCRGGTCISNCDDTLCPSGEECNGEGVCAPSACAGITCDAGDRCVDGSCQPDPCDSVTCGPGKACVNGQCYDDPCKTVTCSDDYHCEIRGDSTICLPDNPAGRQVLVQAGGGGGCSTGGGGSAGLAIALATLVSRRRRSVGGAA